MARHEIETVDQFRKFCADEPDARAVVQALDLWSLEAQLLDRRWDGSIFLGCQVTQRAAEKLAADGALLFPRLPGLPFNAYRSALYTPQDLFTDPSLPYSDSMDARTYQWQAQPRNITRDAGVCLAMALHDHAMSDALAEALEPADRVVGIMGGHAWRRDTDEYRQAAELGSQLAAIGCTVITGGGPGAMEAANLGASWFDDPEGRDRALAGVATVPSFRPSVDDWVAAAWPHMRNHRFTSLGIPTWHYGHEPPNVFAAHIAKYFDNAQREAALLAACDAGIIFLPGAAGTVQELFQATTAAYYSEAPVGQLILVDKEYWTNKLPVWPLLEALAANRTMAARIHLVDTVEAARQLVAVDGR